MGAGRRRRNGQPATYTTTSPPADANARAEKLLLSHLSPAQRVQFTDKGWFEVIGGKTGRTYRVDRHAWPGKNVTWWQDGSPCIAYCAFPNFARSMTLMPMGDTLLAQKLALENPERETTFIDMACKMDYRDNRDHRPYYGDLRPMLYGTLGETPEPRQQRRFVDHPAVAVFGCFLIAVLITLVFH